MMDFLPTLKKQEGILEKLNELSGLLKEKRNMDILTRQDLIVPLMFTMLMNAEIRKKQEKYDMATLLLYRLLEMIEQRRLAVYNLYISQMKYAELAYNLERQPHLEGMTGEERLKWLKETVIYIRKELFKKNINPNLSDQISLLDGFILLLALNDEMFEENDGRPMDKLRRIRSMVFLRNNSIFAHGLGPVSKDDFMKFRKFIMDLFIEFCMVEKIDFDSYIQDIQWLNPLDSKNYVRMGESGE